MLGIYLFAAVLGLGLLAFSLGDDADGGNGHGIGHGHAGDLLLGFFRPRNLIFFAAGFGVTGALLTWTGTAAFFTAILAAAMGFVAMGLSHGVFRYLRRTEAAGEAVGDMHIEGAVARVIVPVTSGARGRVVANIGGREVHVVARLAPGAAPLAEGKEALVVRMVDGEAEVSPYNGTV